MSRGVTPQRIVHSARRLFSRHGFERTSVEMIANDLGVRKAALYYHIPSKVDLLITIMRELLEPLDAQLQAIVHQGGPGVEKLRHAVATHVEGLLSHQEAAQIFFEQRQALPPEAAKQVHTIEERIAQDFRAIVLCGMQDGTLRPVTDATLAALQVLALANWPYRWFRADGRLTSTQLASVVADYAVRMLQSGGG